MKNLDIEPDYLMCQSYGFCNLNETKQDFDG